MSRRSTPHEVATGLVVAATFAASSVLPPMVGSVAIGVGTEMLAGLIERNWDRLRHQILNDELVFDPDLQAVVRRSFVRAVEQIENLWWKSPPGDRVRRGTGENRDSVEALFQMLREDAATILTPERIDVLAADADAIRALLGNQPEVHLAFNQYLGRYLYGHDEQLVTFLREYLPLQLAQCFAEELRSDSPEGRRAWRLYEHIVFSSLQFGMGELQSQQTDLSRKLEAWATERETQEPDKQNSMTKEILDAVVLEIGERMVVALSEQFARNQNEIRTWFVIVEEAIASEAAQTRSENRAEHYSTRAEIAERADRISSELEQGIAGIRLDLRSLPASASLVPPDAEHGPELCGTASRRIWSLPHRPSRLLVGRENLLQDLKRHLVPLNRSPAIVILLGMGGVGKTELAATYAHRHATDFTVVWTINADDHIQITESFAKLGQELGLPEANSGDLGDATAAVRSWLEQSDVPWLLVFENAEDARVLGPYLPALGNGRIIITSRDPAWASIGQPLQLGTLSEIDGAAYLLHRTGGRDEMAARELARELGGLPLALVQAAAYVEATRISLRGYLELYRVHPLHLLEEGRTADPNFRSVATTWDLAFRKLEETRPAAAQLLTFLSVLAPNSIPLDVISSFRGLFPEPLNGELVDGLSVTRVVRSLLSHSLIEVIDDRTLAIHRLVQLVMRDRLTEEELHDRACTAIDLVTAAFPSPPDDIASWPAAERLIAHGLSALNCLEATNTIYFDGGHIRSSIGLYLLARGQIDEAHHILSQSVQIGALVLAPNDPALAKRYANLAAVYIAQGQSALAVELLERAIAIENESLPPDHPQLATDLSNLCTALQAQGDLPGARQRFEQALAIHETALGPDHVDVGIDLNNLGSVLGQQGFYVEAARYIQHALAIAEAWDGPDHPRVATRLFNLASVYSDMGKLEEAQQQLERALSIDERALGTEHPEVRRDLHALAELFGKRGNHAAAHPLLERALTIDEATKSPNSEKVAISLTQVGVVRMKLGDVAGARPLLERALALREEALGQNHPDVAASLNNLASVMLAQDEYVQARSLFLEAMAIWKQAGNEEMASLMRKVITTLDRR